MQKTCTFLPQHGTAIDRNFLHCYNTYSLWKKTVYTYILILKNYGKLPVVFAKYAHDVTYSWTKHTLIKFSSNPKKT